MNNFHIQDHFHILNFYMNFYTFLDQAFHFLENFHILENIKSLSPQQQEPLVNMSDYTSWTTDRVASWLEGISPVFKKYTAAFKEEVSGDMLPDFDDEALVELGIPSKLHRKRILRAVSDLTNDGEEAGGEKVSGPKTEGNSAGGPSKKAKIETYVGTMVSMPKPKGKAANSLASSIDFFNDQDQHHRRLTYHRQISPTNQQQMSATKSRKMRNRTIIVESLTGGLS